MSSFCEPVLPFLQVHYFFVVQGHFIHSVYATVSSYPAVSSNLGLRNLFLTNFTGLTFCCVTLTFTCAQKKNLILKSISLMLVICFEL